MVHPHHTVTFLWTLLLEVLVRPVVWSRLRRTRRRNIRVFTLAGSYLPVSLFLISFYFVLWSIPSCFQRFAVAPNLLSGNDCRFMNDTLRTNLGLVLRIQNAGGAKIVGCTVWLLQSDWLFGLSHLTILQVHSILHLTLSLLGNPAL